MREWDSERGGEKPKDGEWGKGAESEESDLC